MRIVALLNFYDESPAWLAACVASCARCCDHLVALDGAYALYPQAQANSGPDQAATVVSTALACGIGVTYEAPQRPWQGNEVEKRQRLLAAGVAVCEPGEDWLLVIDADELVVEVPSDLRRVLSDTDAPVATYRLVERLDYLGASERLAAAARQVALPAAASPIRGLLRADPTLHLDGNHYMYARHRNGGRETLWAGPCDVVDTDLVLEHRHEFRARWRRDQADMYYRRRDRAGIERRTGAAVAR